MCTQCYRWGLGYGLFLFANVYFSASKKKKKFSMDCFCFIRGKQSLNEQAAFQVRLPLEQQQHRAPWQKPL